MGMINIYCVNVWNIQNIILTKKTRKDKGFCNDRYVEDEAVTEDIYSEFWGVEKEENSS